MKERKKERRKRKKARDSSEVEVSCGRFAFILSFFLRDALVPFLFLFLFCSFPVIAFAIWKRMEKKRN
ncbi:hypothetical protein CSUI_006192 [Cystoisospora suis]|uniref:Transmembrane protein n=1 Tax=Cystoisospora suis TaxID=483139 RepID=A0A2C6KUU0_9APIC|nr:hypothetical protein CSUI_006192 [Cystoisospora suis]